MATKEEVRQAAYSELARYRQTRGDNNYAIVWKVHSDAQRELLGPFTKDEAMHVTVFMRRLESVELAEWHERDHPRVREAKEQH